MEKISVKSDTIKSHQRVWLNASTITFIPSDNNAIRNDAQEVSQKKHRRSKKTCNQFLHFEAKKRQTRDTCGLWRKKGTEITALERSNSDRKVLSLFHFSKKKRGMIGGEKKKEKVKFRRRGTGSTLLRIYYMCGREKKEREKKKKKKRDGSVSFRFL